MNGDPRQRVRCGSRVLRLGLRVTAARVMAVVLCAAPTWTQASDVSHRFTPYLWGAGLTGTLGAGGVDIDMDASFSDILSNLDLGFMATYRGDIHDDWLVAVDGIYIGLGGRGRGPNGLLQSRVELDQTVVELDVGRKLAPGIALIAGARYVDMTSELKTRGPLGNTVTFRTDADWIDPVLGLIASTDISEKGSASLRADVGGFGVGSELTWQVVGSLGYQMTPMLSIVAAYRHLDMDYDSGSGPGEFRFDAAMSGPALGVTFCWR
jgi:hypothetical protein